ncbi:hypothetical protein T265_09901 [Opisthorchis viverrini]|uniref:Uncharacterized protein n=1 Tax=Opisthorchis viverrini TaxID=6198 RepID=A0A074Z485_OPIVI|nr:hypothetical protein T265_09901 [Opisthorchis viverrini]KER21868.1 hypothetical protein T265_09901 [Opisthorchis viverrini]
MGLKPWGAVQSGKSHFIGFVVWQIKLTGIVLVENSGDSQSEILRRNERSLMIREGKGDQQHSAEIVWSKRSVLAYRASCEAGLVLHHATKYGNKLVHVGPNGGRCDPRQTPESGK